MRERLRLSKLRESPRAIALATLAVLIVYAIWMAGPYLRSIVARDAAVTSWITVAHAPIAGRIEDPLFAGTRVGPDGRIATIVDERADATPLARAEAERASAEAERAALAVHVAALEAIVAERESAARAFADTFRADLEDEIASLRAGIAWSEQALAHEIDEAERQERMMADGASSQTEADLARVRALDRERELSNARAALLRAERRLLAVASGAFLLFDESDAGDAARALDEVRIALTSAGVALAGADATLAAQEAVVAAASAHYERQRNAVIVAPEGAIVWNLIGGPGTDVPAGAPIAAWIDCTVLLVDVPITDLEASLLMPGTPANVAVEGEDDTRSGTVIFTRGAAATLAHDDLAAVAKGRAPGTGQAIVALDPRPADAVSCPVGRAAFVDFPGIGVIDMIAARLRL